MRNVIRAVKSDESGFTLLEAIVSIGVLALLSAFILQMFIVSAGANQRAQAIDIACAEAVTAIDVFQGGSRAEDFLESDFMKGVDKGGVEEKPVTRGHVVYSEYIIKKDCAVKGGAEFTLEIDIHAYDSSKNENLPDAAELAGKLYEIRVTATSKNGKTNIYTTEEEYKDARELLSFTATKYFGE